MFDEDLLKRQARLISHSGLAECAAALAGRTRVEDLKPKNFAVTSRWSGAVPLHRPSAQRLPQTPRNTWRGDLATQCAKTTRWTQPSPRAFRGPARCLVTWNNGRRASHKTMYWRSDPGQSSVAAGSRRAPAGFLRTWALTRRAARLKGARPTRVLCLVTSANASARLSGAAASYAGARRLDGRSSARRLPDSLPGAPAQAQFVGATQRVQPEQLTATRRCRR